MIRITDAAALPAEDCAVTIGKFDGIHRGHQVLIDAVKDAARREGLKTVVFTFAVSPKTYLGTETEALMTQEEKEAYLEQERIDYLIEYPFTDEVRHMDAEVFAERALIFGLHMKYLAVGTDFCFGYKRQGNCALLKTLSEKYHFRLDIFSKLKYNGKDISSSLIRTEIRSGHMEDAAAMLGRPYGFGGIVEHGKSLGHTIGFPTLNLCPPDTRVLPPRGVYFASVRIDGNEYCGVANLGIQPTVSSHRLLLEIYVLDFDRMIYGASVWADLLKFHRPERRFDGIEALSEQLKRDTADCVRFFEERRADERKRNASQG